MKTSFGRGLDLFLNVIFDAQTLKNLFLNTLLQIISSTNNKKVANLQAYSIIFLERQKKSDSPHKINYLLCKPKQLGSFFKLSNQASSLKNRATKPSK